jgi:hypothetical protein
LLDRPDRLITNPLEDFRRRRVADAVNARIMGVPDSDLGALTAGFMRATVQPSAGTVSPGDGAGADNESRIRHASRFETSVIRDFRSAGGVRADGPIIAWGAIGSVRPIITAQQQNARSWQPAAAGMAATFAARFLVLLAIEWLFEFARSFLSHG